RRKDGIGTVSQHPGADDHRRPLFRTLFTAIDHQAEIALPKGAGVSVGCGHAESIVAIADGLYPVFEPNGLEIEIGAAHRSAHLAAWSSLRWRMSWLCRLLEKRQQVRAPLIVFDAREGHLVARNEMLRIRNPVVERLVVPDHSRRLKG